MLPPVELPSVKPPLKDPPKSNPSKRHRERLNGELDHLASLLPFEQSIISKLDKLSILRLGVSYLRTKSFFQAVLHDRYGHEHNHITRSHLYTDPGFSEGESLLQALNGFVFLVTCPGEVFFASKTVEQYLGFHQSDIIHQSVMELIHSEDRETFKNQLQWNSQLPPDKRDMTLQEIMLPENSRHLHRSFTVRFRCLLDNTSGFITLEISGRIRVLHGQSMKGEDPPLALFAICCPFGPLPSLDSPMREFTFKTKHKMDLSPLTMDQRGKILFGYSDKELNMKGGYDLIHPDDLHYYSAAHQELIKTGSSGLIAYRLWAKDLSWVWLQTSSKVIYKNSKPDFVISTHRHLTEDEGRDLLGKRGTEFKLPYPLLDASDIAMTSFPETPVEEPMKLKQRTKKTKSQFRDYLNTGRKRKHPYREVLNGYSPFPQLPYNCQNTDIKADLVYPYSGTNYPLETEMYYPYSTLYPDSFRLDDSKSYNSYSNGYVIDRQYPMQYGNSYADFVGAAAKYSYDISKYGYDNYPFDIKLYENTDYKNGLLNYEYSKRDPKHAVSVIQGPRAASPRYEPQWPSCSKRNSPVNGDMDKVYNNMMDGSPPVTSALSVIQHGSRTCEKTNNSSIPVPVVKPSPWLHHVTPPHVTSPTNQSYDYWSNDAALNCHQRALTNAAMTSRVSIPRLQDPEQVPVI